MMMKRVIYLSVFVAVINLATTNLFGQSAEKETRNVSGFTEIGFGIAGNLYINIGPEFKVILEGEKKVLEDIITEVSGRRLLIKKENWRLNMNEKVNVYITMPEIKGLSVSGSGKAEIKDAVKTENLNLSVSGSGKLYTNDMMVSNLDCRISGSGGIILGGTGNATKADISISGSGNFSGEPVKIGSAEIHISGSGNCDCNVTESTQGRCFR